MTDLRAELDEALLRVKAALREADRAEQEVAASRAEADRMEEEAEAAHARVHALEAENARLKAHLDRIRAAVADDVSEPAAKPETPDLSKAGGAAIRT